uniref:Protein kinase domain-containing protein n=1 Tax=Ditylenchus dipsaci TaxID=166011 RepID=A0A915DEF3_9BILA
MAKSSNGFVGEQYRRILAMYSEIPSFNGLERRFYYAYSQIKLIEECLTDSETKSSLVKQLVSWALQEFNVSDFKSDIRMLYLWKLLGKYSVEYKMEGVMEKLNDLGFFKTKPEFYLAWAEHWTTQGNRTKVDSILKLCSDNCKLNSNQLSDLFGHLLTKFSHKNDGDTVALINLLQKEKVAESSSSSVRVQQPNSATKQPSKVVEDTTTTLSTRLYKNAIDVFANTLPYAEAGAPSSDTHKTMTAEPETGNTLTYTTANPNQAMLQVVSSSSKQSLATQRVKNDIIKLGDSPLAKKTRKSIQQQLSFNEENLMNNSSKEGERSFDMCVKRTPPDFMTDDVTVAGYHGKFACSLATSTPQRGGCSMAPGLNLFSPTTIDGDGFFGEEQQKSDQVKLFNVQPSGSTLHKRLSLSKNEADRIMAGAQQDVASVTSSTEKERCYALKSVDKSKSVRRVYEDILKWSDAENKENEGLNETTGNGNGREMITGTVNPWDDEERNKILKHAPLMVEYHDFLDRRCPKIELNRKIELSGEYFQIQKLLGEGGFAKVYKASTDDNKHYAIKYEIPPCPWEFYICASLRSRINPIYLPFVMEIRDAFIFSNASAIVYDFYPLGTLLDMSNAIKKTTTSLAA